MKEIIFSPNNLKPLHSYIESLKNVETIEAYKVSSDLKKLYIDFVLEEQSFENDIEQLINLFCKCDHLFYMVVLSRITSEDDHALLIRAIGNFGQLLSLRFQQYVNQGAIRSFEKFDICKALFVIKGTFNLAHMSFAKSFLKGFSIDQEKNVQPYFVFLDENVPKEIESISFALSGITTYKKLLMLHEIIKKYHFGTIIWPSVSQNISLYLGSRFTKQQIYWSARYRNSLFDTVDKYFFGSRFCSQSVQYNGVSWGYGRFFVAEWDKLNIINASTSVISASDKMWKSFIQRKISNGFILCATISSDRKMQNSDFNLMILNLLKSNPRIYYFYTSRAKYCSLESLLLENGFQNRFKKIEWINCMSPILSLFDLILDSYPVGASHALCYALRVKTPFVSMYSPQNLQSSLLETIAPLVKKLNLTPNEIGFANSQQHYFSLASSLCMSENKHLRVQLLERQSKIIAQCLDNPNGMYRDFSDHIKS